MAMTQDNDIRTGEIYAQSLGVFHQEYTFAGIEQDSMAGMLDPESQTMLRMTSLVFRVIVHQHRDLGYTTGRCSFE
jgi:hypothetical protein